MNLNFLPIPRKVEYTSGICTLKETFNLINIDDITPQISLTLLESQLSSISQPQTNSPFTIRLSRHSDYQKQGYRLQILPDSITIEGGSALGVHYGIVTLIQILEQSGKELPTLLIEDYPDFPTRGVMLDISRDKVPTMQTLFELVDMFMEMKINQIQLYMEHTFAYKNHEVVWKDLSPMTAEEIQTLDLYCQERFIELVPNQNSFGHLHRWLKLDEYTHLAEAPDGWMTPWQEFRIEPHSINPTDPQSLELMRELFDELLPNFNSDLFNVGCDETWDVGQGKNKDLVEEVGRERVYLDYLLKIYDEVKARGKTMMFWGDIVNQHPELIPEIPRDTIALEWWYEDVNQYMEKCKLFADSQIPFYVCPGTSSWATISGRTQNCIANIQSAIEAGLEHGAIGVLNTDWGDMGHWQPLPISYLGFAYGAATSWCYEPNKDINLPTVLDTFIFKDKNHIMGQLAYDLGNAYLKPELTIFNSNLIFWMYHNSLTEMRSIPRYSSFAKSGQELITDWNKLSKKLEETSTYIHHVIGNIEDADMQRDDADLIQSEFVTVANMLLLAIDDAQQQIQPTDTPQQLIARLDTMEQQFKSNWLARNREGGLADSVARFNTLRKRNQ